MSISGNFSISYQLYIIESYIILRGDYTYVKVKPAKYKYLNINWISIMKTPLLKIVVI